MVSSAACVGNIGPRQRLLRWTFAGIMTVVAGVLTAWLIATDQPRWTRLFVAIPAWFALLNIFQARNQTCVFLAARGKTNFDQGEQAVADSQLDQRLRRQARMIVIQTTLATVLVAAVCFLLPPWD